VRNHYLAVARTYLRPMFLLWSVAFACSLCEIATSLRLDLRLREISPDGWSIGLMAWSINAMVLAWLGVLISAHLKELLGSPNSRLTPNLIGRHFAMVGLITVVFAIGIPLAIAFGFGFSDSRLTVVALLLVAFAIGAFLGHWSPNFAAIVAPMAVILLCNLNPSLLQQTGATLIAIVLSFGALLVVAFRLGRFSEEMPEYRRRMQMPFARPDTRFVSPNAAVGGWDWLRLVPIRRDFRALSRRGGLANESLIERALHWHAVWRIVWPAVGAGAWIGCLLAGMALLRGYSAPELLGSPCIPYLAVFPALRVLGPKQNRPLLAGEFLRPLSRKEHVRAVGLALAAMVVLCWLLMLTTAFSVLLLFSSDVPSMPNLLQSLGFSMCCLCVAFGLAVWPYRTSAVFYVYSAFFGVMASFELTPLRWNKIAGVELGWVSVGLFVIGIFVTCRSYLRWLNHDAFFSTDSWISNPDSWISKLPRDRRIESQLQQLVVVASIEDRNRKSPKTDVRV
jgi:hypothetical protein